ncbi:hypothetical protein [Ralstonia phage RSP15]|uniref:hypothetical protein n=1 Tax=Ralstonia phage RSP15 TaxID=1785960 RepID=UPI00074D3C5E|nr:hypothetical protein BH754_gp108 [Ralstonia phage RSP15]BAU40198.1 hypothetical protein [Ralstonia phage RSP15]
MATSNNDQSYANLLVQLGALNDKLDLFINGKATDLVQTNNGPVRTISGIEAHALENRWVQRVVDYRTVAEAILYINNYPDGQLFRIYGEGPASQYRNGIYMRQGDAIIRVNLQEYQDVQDPTTPHAVTSWQRLPLTTTDEQWQSLEIGPFDPASKSDYICEITVLGRNIDDGTPWIYGAKRGGAFYSADNLSLSYEPSQGNPDYFVMVGASDAFNRVAVYQPLNTNSVILKLRGDAARRIEWYAEVKTVELKKPA